MENWMKNNLKKLEITPKSENWEQISSRLGSEKRNKKRLIFVVFVLLALASYLFPLVRSFIPVSEHNAANEGPMDTVRSEGNKWVDLPDQEETMTFTKPEVLKLYRNHDYGQNVVLKNNTKTSVEINENDSDKMEAKWSHLLKQKMPIILLPKDSSVIPKIDLSAITLVTIPKDSALFQLSKNKPRKSILIPSKLYLEYQKGIYIFPTKSYLDIANNAVNNLDIGIGYTIYPRFSLDLGVGFYNGSITSFIGDKIVVSQIEYSLGTSNTEGLNESMDTLSFFSSALYDDFKDKDIYLKGTNNALTQTITGYGIPITLNYNIATINNVSFKSRLGLAFNFVKDYSSLSYLNNYQVVVRNDVNNKDWHFNSFTFRGGLLAEYKPKKFGVFLSASLAVNRSRPLNKSIFTDNYQPSFGAGFNYYLKTN
jgi:hypothetical protein